LTFLSEDAQIIDWYRKNLHFTKDFH